MKSFDLPDARGWIGIGAFLLAIIVLLLLAFVPDLRKDTGFMTLATLVVGTGFIGGPVSWAYTASKTGGELAARNADIVEQNAKP